MPGMRGMGQGMGMQQSTQPTMRKKPAGPQPQQAQGQPMAPPSVPPPGQPGPFPPMPQPGGPQMAAPMAQGMPMGGPPGMPPGIGGPAAGGGMPPDIMQLLQSILGGRR